MPKQRAEAATRQVLFRLTEREYEALCAVAYLEGRSPTEVARERVAAALANWASSPRVMRVIRERQEYEAEFDGRLASLPEVRAAEANHGEHTRPRSTTPPTATFRTSST